MSSLKEQAHWVLHKNRSWVKREIRTSWDSSGTKFSLVLLFKYAHSWRKIWFYWWWKKKCIFPLCLTLLSMQVMLAETVIVRVTAGSALASLTKFSGVEALWLFSTGWTHWRGTCWLMWIPDNLAYLEGIPRRESGKN